MLQPKNLSLLPASKASMRRPTGHIPGFSLVELLVVISVTAMLMIILMPALGSARETARQAKCGSGLRQLGIAYISYMNDNKGWTVDSRDFYKDEITGSVYLADSSQVIWGNVNPNKYTSPVDYGRLGRLWEGYFGGDPKQPSAKSLELYYCPSAVQFQLNKDDVSQAVNMGSKNPVRPMATTYYMRGVPQGAPQRTSDVRSNQALAFDSSGWRGGVGNHKNLISVLYTDGKVNRVQHPDGWRYHIPPNMAYGSDHIDFYTKKLVALGPWSQIEAGKLTNIQ